MKTLSTIGLLAALAAVPALSQASPDSPHTAADHERAHSAATIVYGPPVVYYGDDWERPDGTQARREQKLEQYARARAVASQSELAAAQWQGGDYSGR